MSTFVQISDASQGEAGLHAAHAKIAAFALRLIGMAVGAALVVASFGLWLMPGTRTEPELALIKLGLSLFMMIGGMCLVVLCRTAKRR